MSIAPSCPILVVHDDDVFRRRLIAALDQRHFTVTYVADGDEALEALQARAFRVIVVGVDVTHRRGLQALDFVRDHRGDLHDASVIVLGEPNPEIRQVARFADETLLKPVDPNYVADRARVYCA